MTAICKMGLAGCGTFLTYILGGWNMALEVLLIVIVTDYISGVVAAAVQGKLSSKVGFQGIGKKVLMLLLVVLAAAIEHIVEMPEPGLRTLVIYFLVVNEGISILENITAAGIPIPDVLRRVLDSLSKEATK